MSAHSTNALADLIRSSAAEQAAALAAGEVSSRELTQAHLDRIAAVDGAVGAFLNVDAECALSQADAADVARKEGQATASSSPARRDTSSSLRATRASAATRATSSVEIADMVWSLAGSSRAAAPPRRHRRLGRQARPASAPLCPPLVHGRQALRVPMKLNRYRIRAISQSLLRKDD